MKEKFTDSKGNFPIDVENGSFHSVSGWMDNHTLLYVTDTNHGSSVFSYNIVNGEETLLYETNAPIVSVIISPKRERILIHSAPSTSEAIITVINPDGSEIISESIPSKELYIKWNPFQDSTLLISAFTEDWDYTAWKLDLDKGNLSEINIPQPFGVWLGKEKLVYLDWESEVPSLTANLKGFNLELGESEDLLSDIYYVDTVGEYLMTIKPDNGNERGTYTFFNENKEEFFSFSTPHLTRYSDWLVPYYDYIKGTDTLLSYQPIYSTEADVYDDGFQLVSYNMKTGERVVIDKGLENAPISCSPDGKMCLTGYYFEKLINLDTKEITTIIEDI